MTVYTINGEKVSNEKYTNKLYELYGAMVDFTNEIIIGDTEVELAIIVK